VTGVRPTLRRVLVANRGEIAVRIVRACFDEGIESVAAVSDADRDSLAARRADKVVRIGPAAASASYLDVGAIVGAAIATGCDAVHPGYGFLSERPELAAECARVGLAFVGPPAEVIRRGGSKIGARALARSIGVPVGEGSDRAATPEEAVEAAERIGYPVLLKASAGGGGRGMVRVDTPPGLPAAFTSAAREAEAAFGDGTLFVERWIGNARHVEVQVLADTHGSVIHLGERDCSAQRRFQ
jgi:acetyl-CoA carboxylase, biotin carboxylase subunit